MFSVILLVLNAFFGYLNLGNSLNSNLPKWLRVVAGASAFFSFTSCVSLGLVLLA